jgi:hypothetical protein
MHRLVHVHNHIWCKRTQTSVQLDSTNNTYDMQTHKHTHNVARIRSYASLKVHFKRKLLSFGFPFPTLGHIAIFTLLSQCSFTFFKHMWDVIQKNTNSQLWCINPSQNTDHKYFQLQCKVTTISTRGRKCG